MRYRITQAFTDSHGMNWSKGDKFRAHEDDDPQIYFDQGFLEDADKPAGNNPAAEDYNRELKEEEARAKKAQAEAEAKEKDRKAGRTGDKSRGIGTGQETHAKAHDDKSGEAEHKGGKAKP